MSNAPSLQLDSATLVEAYDRLGIRQFHHGLELLDVLGLGEGERVLDVGCGTGRLTESAAQRAGQHGEVLGLDPLPLRVQTRPGTLRACAHGSRARSNRIAALAAMRSRGA